MQDEWKGTEVLDNDLLETEVDHTDQGHYSSLLWLYTLFLLMFQSMFRVSDRAMNVFNFFAMFFVSLAKHVPSLPREFVSNLPKSKRVACAVANTTQSIKKFVCCPSCHSLYTWGDCILYTEDGQKESKLCSFREFPNHPQSHHRHQCGGTLMK